MKLFSTNAANVFLSRIWDIDLFVLQSQAGMQQVHNQPRRRVQKLNGWNGGLGRQNFKGGDTSVDHDTCAGDQR